MLHGRDSGESLSEEAAFTVTLKADGGYDAPWLVVRGNNLGELGSYLSALSPAAAEAVQQRDILTAINLTASEFSGKKAVVQNSAAVVTKQGEVPVQNNDPWAPGPNPAYNAGPTQEQPYGGPANEVPVQQEQRSFGAGAAAPSNHIPIPVGDKSGIPMKYREGTGSNGEYWAFMSAQDRNTPPNQKDKTIWLKEPLPADHPARQSRGRGR